MVKSTGESRSRDTVTETAESGPCFEQLFERYCRPVSYFFARRGFSQDECLDLTQETFLGVCRGIERFRTGTNVEKWLYTIAINVWRNEIRRRSTAKRDAKEVGFDDILGTAREIENGQDTDPLKAVLTGERHDLLHEAIRELPSQMRQCLILRIDQHLKYDEIAKVMRISINTVKSQLFQARGKLRARLAEAEDDVVVDGGRRTR